MNEKIKEIIENEMDCLITDVDFVIKKEGSLQALVNMLEQAINYTRCCEELPTKEAELSELEKLVEQQANSNIKLFKKDGYIGGFCDGFRLYSNWLRNK